MQEELLRKAHQKDAITAMEEERKRRIAEDDPHHKTTDEQVLVLEELGRKVQSYAPPNEWKLCDEYLTSCRQASRK